MAALPQPYETRLVAVSASSINQQRINYGSRVLLPSSVLDDLCRITMVYPLQFEIITPAKKRVYAAVLEFNAQAGSVVLPDWMFQHLGLCGTMVVKVQSCSLPPGSLVKLRPHQKALVMFENPRHLLELRLAQYPVLTKGTTIVISYVDREFQLDLVDIIDMKQEFVNGILTVRADGAPVELKVDFERPLDMPPSPPETPISAVASPTGANVIGASSPTGVQFQPFNFRPPSLTDGPKVAAGAPPLKHLPGQSSSSSSGPKGSNSAAEPEQPTFAGTGRTLSGVLPSENQTNEASASAPAVPLAARPSAEELRAIRLKALGGGGRS
ncbi:putative ubiquitin fusion degradation protein [Leishmania major strain Friedlin]|uniref:Putative ubiquitin fusion degradation protein n=1 Tax=Leishmania major TaxID=5664 RepID=Q4Q0A8_LEIMA|nr:putative ubiquitin fusion degradation protein [Leishmania major strain Friedlin]CAG9584211.1 ubiquitin_fusion_degradation_protein_-_putative [Leishmania major strain Friedlin]CAJ09627.1 putative ubiquitin fusion degradation protein [Leishmania major strain Friedlin]|eukprot:XP_001687240.1 putative ubiquitin fusion degradation protein [Leishmania major strain Friedlin]